MGVKRPKNGVRIPYLVPELDCRVKGPSIKGIFPSFDVEIREAEAPPAESTSRKRGGETGKAPLETSFRVWSCRWETGIPGAISECLVGWSRRIWLLAPFRPRADQHRPPLGSAFVTGNGM